MTVEEYEALRENIPLVKMTLYVTKSAVQLQVADHRITCLPRNRKYLENRVSYTAFLGHMIFLTRRLATRFGEQIFKFFKFEGIAVFVNLIGGCFHKYGCSYISIIAMDLNLSMRVNDSKNVVIRVKLSDFPLSVVSFCLEFVMNVIQSAWSNKS